MNYYKRIILDFDDTLAFTTNRQWDDAKPNTKLIKRINQLYDQGWQIDIFTARGSLSCKTRKDAEKKYRSGIEKWLKKHKVKYHILSFDKPLGAYYIDDKAITPEDFLNVEIAQLQGGLSGADIYSDGEYVHKTSSNSNDVKVWYETVNKKINVPKVRSVVGETITLEYIAHDKDYFKNNFYVAMGLVEDGLERLKKIKPIKKYSFNDYIKRISEQSKKLPFKLSYDIISELKSLKLKQVFAHGDYGITNMLFKKNQMYMIDPLTHTFGCTEIDAGKFCASLYINKYNNKTCQEATKILSDYCNLSVKQMNCIIVCEIIRVYKNHNNKKFIENIIKKIIQG